MRTNTQAEKETRTCPKLLERDVRLPCAVCAVLKADVTSVCFFSCCNACIGAERADKTSQGAAPTTKPWQTNTARLSNKNKATATACTRITRNKRMH